MFSLCSVDETQLGGLSSLLAGTSAPPSAATSNIGETNQGAVSKEPTTGDKSANPAGKDTGTRLETAVADKTCVSPEPQTSGKDPSGSSKYPPSVTVVTDTLTTSTITLAGRPLPLPTVPAIPSTPNLPNFPMQPLSLSIVSSDSPLSDAAASLLVDLNVASGSANESPPALAISSNMTNLPSPPSTPPSPLTPTNPNVPRPPKKRYLQQALAASMQDVSMLELSSILKSYDQWNVLLNCV